MKKTIVIKKVILLVAYLLYATSLFGQDVNFNFVTSAFENNNTKKAITELKKIDTISNTKFDKATWLYYFSTYNLKKGKRDVAYKSILQAKEFFSQIQNIDKVMDCNIQILKIYYRNRKLKKEDVLSIINILKKYEKGQNNPNITKKIFPVLGNVALFFNHKEEALEYFNQAIKISKNQNDFLREGQLYISVSNVYGSIEPYDLKSSLYYLKKAIPILTKHNDNQKLSYCYNNTGYTYYDLGKYNKAIEFYIKADSIPLVEEKAVTKNIFYENMADAYYQNKEYQNASKYLQKKIALQDSINDTQQNIAISDIKEKYDTEKLRADNLESEAARKKNLNLLIATLTFLLFSIVVGFLIYKNIIRKKRIAEKEKQLEKQKVTNLLKEQELIAIDAMIAGQEKERQLIASDLHDDLGALMATLQLNFENLDKHRNSKDSEMLFSRTKTLIKDAYQKIRSIAHAKNSGVIAKQGLLTAITNNANKISNLNGIKIDVIEHGLEENRLENSLELTIFRIVQELITNIIKHADATHAIIHFTNHKDSLNIMVEDDGKGFDTKNISKSKGMGIRSIEKRIEFLGGTMTVESIPTKGTTVIIDIPL